MAAWSLLLGTVLAWLILLAGSLGAGFGLVLAWQRWGQAVSLPPRIAPLALRLMGTPRGVPPVGAERPPAAAPTSDAIEASDVEPAVLMDAAEVEPEAAVADVADAPEDPVPVDPSVGSNDTAETTPAAQPLGVQPSPAEAMRSPRQLSRADAIEELVAMFELPYDDAVALVEAGLWGMDTFEEWSRSMRGQEPPDGVDPALVTRITKRTIEELQPALESYRERRGALRALEGLWGVGPDEAEALYDAGFTTEESLRKASTDKLARVEGIGMAKAFQVRAAAHGLAPTP